MLIAVNAKVSAISIKGNRQTIFMKDFDRDSGDESFCDGQDPTRSDSLYPMYDISIAFQCCGKDEYRSSSLPLLLMLAQQTGLRAEQDHL